MGKSCAAIPMLSLREQAGHAPEPHHDPTARLDVHVRVVLHHHHATLPERSVYGEVRVETRHHPLAA